MQQADQQLSPHFWLSELTSSQLATRQKLQNIPLGPQVENLRRLALLLEDVRLALHGVPMIVSSGFRSRSINRLVGGAPNSAHCDGRAADFTAPSFGSPRQICQRLHDCGVVYDQLIYEQAWVHIAVPPPDEAPRREALTAFFHAYGPPTYAKGLL